MTQKRKAFSIAEMVVVTIAVGVMAGIALPRVELGCGALEHTRTGLKKLEHSLSARATGGADVLTKGAL